MGDLNLPTLVWDSGRRNHGEYITSTDRWFYGCFEECGLTQLVTEATFLPSGNTLDLILCTDPDRFLEVEYLPPLPRCHHCPVLSRLIYQSNTRSMEEECDRYSWNRGNYAEMLRELHDMDWVMLFE